KLLRLPESLHAKLDAAALARFFANLRQIPGITQVKLNALARSCTITYTPSLLPDHVWRETFVTPPPLSPTGQDFWAALQRIFPTCGDQEAEEK
ncbi:MAG: hypothetical protein LBD68_04245, partial [Zoogloeaceae bacterium]|nr:hypothetical protein [Zoogloeaceae bacterium]